MRTKGRREGNWPLYLKGLGLCLSAAILYAVLVFGTPAVAVSLLLCVALGVNLAFLGFNVMHEGGHQSFSRHRWVNRLTAYSLNVLGGTAYYWKIKHNINHHTHTNIDGLDSDIDVKPFMRLHKGQPWRPYHRFQHIYWILLYGISYLAWVFYEDFQKYFSGRIYVTAAKTNMPLREHFIFWITKLFYIGAYVVLPVFIIGWLPWLIGFVVVTIVCGVVISLVFQLAHVVENTQFHQSPDRSGKHNWAVGQVVSTANFATRSRWLTWFLGGLNFQIEHHLFPRISHRHYRAISVFVRNTCRDFNLRYNENTTLLKAVMSHIRHLRTMGAAS